MAVVNEKNIITTYFDYVSNAPIITFPGYEDIVPHEMKTKVSFHRLLESQDIIEKMATDFESIIYLSTASFENLLSHSWYKIYIHTFSKYFQIPENFRKVTIEKIYPNEMINLKKLKSWLYKTQINKMKTEK